MADLAHHSWKLLQRQQHGTAKCILWLSELKLALCVPTEKETHHPWLVFHIEHGSLGGCLAPIYYSTAVIPRCMATVLQYFRLSGTEA